MTDSRDTPGVKSDGISAASDPALRVQALEALLVEKGLVDPTALDALVESYETRIGPHIGAALVARAWTDPAFKQRLADNAAAAMAELGHPPDYGANLVTVENTRSVHNLVVCTLCSCYPWRVLGLPPAWYKSAPYRSRAVIEPRKVLKEFGVELADDIAVRVWDSTAELRYLVLPQRPPATDGLDEAGLAALVTRDSMIGAGLAHSPDRRNGAAP